MIKKRKFRRKQVEIEAYQTTEEKIIHTTGGDVKASVGDWIITGIKGEEYPCKPDIFVGLYEEIEDTE